MDNKDYSKWTSEYYDDRDGDTLTSLKGLKKVCDNEAPKKIFFVVPAKFEEDGTLHMNVVQYVRYDTLPKDIREHLDVVLEAFSKSET